MNDKIKKAARAEKIPMWRISDTLGISEATMTRKLRHELPREETERILAIIDKLAAEKAEKEGK